jgi:hypothetical protein
LQSIITTCTTERKVPTSTEHFISSDNMVKFQ